jgi:hypothetical protein
VPSDSRPEHSDPLIWESCSDRDGLDGAQKELELEKAVPENCKSWIRLYLQTQLRNPTFQ